MTTMTMSLWNFISILLGVFALGTVVGIGGTLIGLTVSHRFIDRGGNEQDSGDLP